MINYIKTVIDSCENFEQLDSCKLWIFNIKLEKKIEKDFLRYIGIKMNDAPKYLDKIMVACGLETLKL